MYSETTVTYNKQKYEFPSLSKRRQNGSVFPSVSDHTQNNLFFPSQTTEGQTAFVGTNQSTEKRYKYRLDRLTKACRTQEKLAAWRERNGMISC
jgi:uridine phosphorylase